MSEDTAAASPLDDYGNPPHISTALASMTTASAELRQLADMLDQRVKEADAASAALHALAAATPAPEGLSDAVLLDFWRSVQGPRAELTGPLIRYAALVFAAARRVQEEP